MITIESKIPVYVLEDGTGYFNFITTTYLQQTKEVRTPHGYIYCDNRDARIPQLALPYLKKYNIRNVNGNIYISPNSAIYQEIMDCAVLDFIKKNKCLPEKENPLALYLDLADKSY